MCKVHVLRLSLPLIVTLCGTEAVQCIGCEVVNYGPDCYEFGIVG